MKSVSPAALIVAGLLAAGARPGAQVSSPPASLSGQIFAAADSSPLARVALTLTGPTLEAPLSVTTDSEGRYEIVNVPPGSYILIAAGDDFHTTKYGERTPGQIPRRIDLKSGETLKRLDFELSRSAQIGGRVLDRSGQPVAGGWVVASRRASNVANPQGDTYLTPPVDVIVASTQADAQGRYRFTDLLPAEYRVAAAPSKTWENTRGEILANLPEPVQTAHIDVADRRLGVDITMANRASQTTPQAQNVNATSQRVANATDLAIAPSAATVSGDVVDPHGAPLVEGTVMVFPVDHATGYNPDRFKAVRPDLEGHYRIAGLPAGRYYLTAKEDFLEWDWLHARFEELAKKAAIVRLAEGTTERVSLAVDYEK